MAGLSPCPEKSFRYNDSLCACYPGYLLELSNNSCIEFQVSTNDWVTQTGVDYSTRFPDFFFSLDTIKKFTQSQAIFLETTLLVLAIWFCFCIVARFNNAEGAWFKVRWWISHLDWFFSTRHWLDDQGVVVKRKTELGGTFSVACCILFVGLFSALLYQAIAKRTIEVHNVRATNAYDLMSFTSDMQFNITTISTMTCSQLRGLGNLITGSPGYIDYKVSPLSKFVNYGCHNTSMGPTITFNCSNCQLYRDNYYISWHFIDLPNKPATAVGFQFNLTSKNGDDNKHVSSISGKLRSETNSNVGPTTFRGTDGNILKFHLSPRIYHNLNDLRLIQPSFHEFISGSSFLDVKLLQASLQNPRDGVINTTLHISFLSDYIVEVNKKNVLGPVDFLADVGGLLATSVMIFLFFLWQCEYRNKKLRDEDKKLHLIRSKKRAQFNWDKLRRYVGYTWAPSTLNVNISNRHSQKRGIFKSLYNLGSLQEKRQLTRKDSILPNKTSQIPLELNVIQDLETHRMQLRLKRDAPEVVATSLCPNVDPVSMSGETDPDKEVEDKNVVVFCQGTKPFQKPLPSESGSSSSFGPELNPDEANVSNIQITLQNLYLFQDQLKEKIRITKALLKNFNKTTFQLPIE